jgi:hypothetical protein
VGGGLGKGGGTGLSRVLGKGAAGNESCRERGRAVQGECSGVGLYCMNGESTVQDILVLVAYWSFYCCTAKDAPGFSRLPLRCPLGNTLLEFGRCLIVNVGFGLLGFVEFFFF